jgi:hypothetical protein
MPLTTNFTRLPDPLVAENPFRTSNGNGYATSSLLPFAEARPRLPQPYLPQFPEWIELYWRSWEMVWSHLTQPALKSKLPHAYIATPHHSHLFMWDMAFMSQYGLYGRRLFDFMGMLNNFYANQHEDGFICRQLEPETGNDGLYPFDPNSSGPNILAWAEWRYFRHTGNDERLASVFAPLVAYHRWCRSYRTWPNGLYWTTGYSSALVNQPRVPDSMYHHRHWSWVDANMQAALNCLLLEQMGMLLKQEEIGLEMAKERIRLIAQINEIMWNEEAAFYQDVDGNGRFSPVKSIAAYWGLLAPGIVPEERVTPFVQHLRDSWAFDLPHRIPAQSADSEGYNAETGNRWRGGVWPATNYMVLKGLHGVGQEVLAHEIGRNHLEQVTAVYQHTDTLWENYAPESSAPGDPAQPNAVGASALSAINILLEDVIGISVDWPLRRVTWDRNLNTDQPYGVHHYPLGTDGRLDIEGTAELITINTTVPFTLTIREPEQTLQTAVAVGTSTIDLT